MVTVVAVDAKGVYNPLTRMIPEAVGGSAHAGAHEIVGGVSESVVPRGTKAVTLAPGSGTRTATSVWITVTVMVSPGDGAVSLRLIVSVGTPTGPATVSVVIAGAGGTPEAKPVAVKAMDAPGSAVGATVTLKVRVTVKGPVTFE
jgi:hypothetical protein